MRARVREDSKLLPGTPFSEEKEGKGPGKLVQPIGEGADEVCLEGLPGLVQGSVIFSLRSWSASTEKFIVSLAFPESSAGG